MHQMILSVVESLSGVYSEEKSSNSTQRRWSLKQESEGSFREKIPDGIYLAVAERLLVVFLIGIGYNGYYHVYRINSRN